LDASITTRILFLPPLSLSITGTPVSP
jgi:hypothetical protein